MLQKRSHHFKVAVGKENNDKRRKDRQKTIKPYELISEFTLQCA